MENYIVINGKKAELTKEQLVALGIEIEKENPFKFNPDYYFIDSMGEINHDYCSIGCSTSELRYNVGNYCTDKALMEQRALHETLNRLLWRYSMQHGGDKINWNDKTQRKYTINFDTDRETFCIPYHQYHKSEGAIYFISQDVAEDALDGIVEPFIKQHPEFRW